MTNVVADMPAANSLLQQLGFRFVADQPYPALPEIMDVGEAALKSLAGTYSVEGDAGRLRLIVDGKALFVEAEGWKAFSLLHSVRVAEEGRLERLGRLMDTIIAGNRAGDFAPLFKAYGGRMSLERLKDRWGEVTKAIENDRGRILKHEILGSARTRDRDETVVRFICENGAVERTYVWDIREEGRLLGMSVRGLAVRLRLFPSGDRDFFSWDGGIRPPKLFHFEAGTDGLMSLRFGESRVFAARKS
jgi:hypothetical protein